MATPGVDFFRVDRSRRTRTLLTVAVVLVAIGASTIGAHLVHRIRSDVGHLISLAGGLTMLIGLVTGFGTMAVMLFENVYLHIEEAHLLFHVNGKDIPIPWDDLAGVDLPDGDGLVVLRRKKGEPVHFHAGGDARNVATRVEEASRKAAHGLLRSQ